MTTSEETTLTISKPTLAIMLLGTFVAAISQSMLTTALPPIMAEFGISAVAGQLLTTAYMYTLGIVAAFTAFLVMRFKKRILYLASLSLFIVGCAIAYSTTSYGLLLASRIMQACGAGILMPLIQVIALETSPKERYGSSLGIVGLVFGFSPVLGPSLSGVITDAWGWRSIFIILGSIAIVVLAISFFLTKRMNEAKEGEKPHLDVLSMLLYTFGLIVIMVGVTGLENYGFLDFRAFTPTLIGIALIISFAIRQVKIDRPYLMVSLFKNKTFTTGAMLLMIAQIVMMASAVQMPMYIQGIMGLSATLSGLLLLPGACCNPILSPIAGKLFDRIGGKPVAIVGFVLVFVGVGGFVLLPETTPLWLIVVMYMLRMAGVAFLMMPMTAYAMSDLKRSEIPHGTAIVNSMRQVVGSLGASVMITISAAFSIGDTDSAGLNLIGFHFSFAILAAIIVVGLIVALIAMKNFKKSDAHS